MEHKSYRSPFSTRYASDEMQYLFSEEYKFRTWRRLWIALAKAQKQQNLPITDDQIAELMAYQENINYEDAIRREWECRHDVMSHIYAYGLQCPQARRIIHLGATSCYVGDNTDLIIMKEALGVVYRKLLGVLSLLCNFARRYKDLPTLAYTHLQPAQLTTVGKRATLWMYEFYLDLVEIQRRIDSLTFLGSKGTTGTQASFMELFDGNEAKIKVVELAIAQEMGFDRVVPVSGQTYSRKMDYQVVSTLSGLAQSASKFSYDIRLLQSFKELEEPFEKAQIGSSAMPYKRNPMRSERITALARYLMIDALNPAFTAGSQCFERTLDDSANKRLSIAEAFLAADAILNLLLNVCDGIIVYPQVIRRRVMEELPFMATENIMMRAVKNGGDRQQLHEKLRVHSQESARRIKEEGAANDLTERICNDPIFSITKQEMESILDPVAFTGRASSQVEEFLQEVIDPLLVNNTTLPEEKGQVLV